MFLTGSLQIGWEERQDGRVALGQLEKMAGSSLLDFQLLWALQVAAKLETELGLPAIANEYQKKALQLQQTIQRNYWSADKKLFADTKDKDPLFTTCKYIGNTYQYN
jgi:hypothetical protein